MQLDQVWQLLDTEIPTLDSERIATESACGRVLAAPLIARCGHPHQDIAAMDGYGFSASNQPQELSLIGLSAAGEPFEGTVQAGQCIRILTGAAIPEGVNTVAMQEDCATNTDTVSVPASPLGKFIRAQGCDFPEGAEIATPHKTLHSRDVALILAAGHGAVSVIKKSRWNLLATGSELRAVDSKREGTINTNIPALQSLLQQHGAEVLLAKTCADDATLLKDTIKTALSDADVVLLTGGVSVGDKDLVRPCLEALGAEIFFHGVLMKPGKPSLLAKIGTTWILGLPGNPVSAQACGYLLALPLLRALSGIPSCAPKFIAAHSKTLLPKGIQRENFLRGHCHHDQNGMMQVRLMPNQDSAGLQSLAKANCLVRVAINAPESHDCTVFLL